MRICYLIDVSPERFKGGGQVHLLNLIQQMQGLKRPGLSPAGRPGLNTFGGQSPRLVFRLCWMLYVIPQVIFNHFFIRKFDLIHAHSIPAMVSGKILSLILKIPIVVTVHGYNGKRWMERLALTKIKYDAQITVARNFLGIPNINKNIIYIPNGIDIVKFILRSRTPLCRAKIHHSNQPPQILFVGRKSDPVKGFKILEKAMELVKQEIPNARLLVAGGDLPGDEVLRLYQQADLFVLPSLSEGFPLTLLEAWAVKLPVVVTKVGELPHLIEDGVNGYLVDPGSAHKLSVAIIKALKNHNLAKLGENGYNLARKFNWRVTAKKTIMIYNNLLSTHQRIN